MFDLGGKMEGLGEEEGGGWTFWKETVSGALGSDNDVQRFWDDR